MKDDLVVSDMKAFLNAKKAAKNVGITNNTLNKYSQVLESYGYLFKKEGNKVAYLEKDIIILKKLKELAISGGMNVHEAAKAVITMFDTSSEIEGSREKLEANLKELNVKRKNLDVTQENLDTTKEKLELTNELEAAKQEIAISKPKLEPAKKEKEVLKLEKVDLKKGLKADNVARNDKVDKIDKADKAAKVGKADKANKADKADNTSVNIESIEEKIDRAIKFIIEREASNEELQKIIHEKDLIISKLKEENANYQKEKEVINLRDKVLLETIRKRQLERKNSVGNLSFWEKRKKG